MTKNSNHIPFDSTLEKNEKNKKLLINIVITFFVLALTAILSEVFRRFNSDKQILVMVYILSVLIISRVTTGYLFGIMASLLNSLIYDFLITEPYMGFSFTIGFPIILFTMLFVTFITCASTFQIKHQARLALEREHRLQLLHEITQKLFGLRDLDSIIMITNEYLVTHMRRSVIFYTDDPKLPESGIFAQYGLENSDKKLFGSEGELDTAHNIYVNPAYPNNDKPESKVYYVPIISKEKLLGLIGISCANSPLTQSGIKLMQMLADQVALALELQFLFEKQNRLLIDAEREKTRAILLRAISHDLRTPLTSIIGASSMLLEHEDRLEWDVSGKLISNINTNARWLIRIVENLLSITKISHNPMKLNKSLEVAEEVAAQSVSIVRKHFPDWQIHIRGPEELLFVPMEATLISQVLINLLENSVKNSKTGSLILVDISTQGDCAKFSVSDNGCGIPEQMLDNLFESHVSGIRKAVDSAQGMGIGLSICKTIIHAHGGTITGTNKKNRGAYFSFLLPLEEDKNYGEQA